MNKNINIFTENEQEIIKALVETGELPINHDAHALDSLWSQGIVEKTGVFSARLTNEGKAFLGIA